MANFDTMKPPRSKLRGITRKGIVCETPRFLTLFPLQGNLGASSEESPDWGVQEVGRTISVQLVGGHQLSAQCPGVLGQACGRVKKLAVLGEARPFANNIYSEETPAW